MKTKTKSSKRKTSTKKKATLRQLKAINKRFKRFKPCGCKARK